MKLKSPMFWVYLVVILYLVSMLVYVSVDFFGDADTDKISAFGSVLGGVGTIFAGLVAIYLFNDWRDQHNKVIVAEVAKQVLVTVNDDLNYISKLTGFLRNTPPNMPLLNSDVYEQVIQKITALLENGMKTSAQTLILFELTKNEHLEARRVGYHQGLIEFTKYMRDIVADNNSAGFLLRYIDSNIHNFLVHNKNYKVEIVSFILAKE